MLIASNKRRQKKTKKTARELPPEFEKPLSTRVGRSERGAHPPGMGAQALAGICHNAFPSRWDERSFSFSLSQTDRFVK